jgi:chromosome segregation ATPase
LKDKLADFMIKIEDLEDEIKSKELNFTQKLSESEESCTDLKKQLKKIEIKMKG